MHPFVIVNLIVFVGIIALLARLRRPDVSLSRQVLTGLVAGLAFGFGLQLAYSGHPDVMAGTLEWTNVVGTTYVNLLRMIVMPLVLIMMIVAVVRMRAVAALGKIGGIVIGILMGTTMIAAFIGILMANLFGLSAEGLVEGARELARAEVLATRQQNIADLGLSDMLRKIRDSVETLQAIIMKLVHMVMALTPYGILALMTKVVASSNADDIIELGTFIVASYLAILIMFGVHALLLRLNGFSVSHHFKSVWPVLAFAFGSRSSAATIPLNVETQVDKLNVPRPIANLSATFGATIGQNGCAGTYPAMLATMIAPTMGIDPMSPGFIAALIGIVAISSFGIAGVGGGATFSALVVLPAMGMPVTLVALLISIEPLIDMARTALNVNGAMTTGVLTSRFLKDLPYDAPEADGSHDPQPVAAE